MSMNDPQITEPKCTSAGPYPQSATTSQPIAYVRIPDADLTRLRAEVEKLRNHLRTIIPMAKGYAHANPVGNNWKFIEQAEAALSAGRERI